MILQAKKLVEQIPEPLSRWVAFVPYSIRLGAGYNKSVGEIQAFEALSSGQRRDYIFRHMKNIVMHAYDTNYAYRDFYLERGFDPKDINEFSDIKKIPVITKSDLKKYDLPNRSQKAGGRLLINTGGTSGEPLDFYIDKDSFAREWAHMHHVWKHVDYKQTDVKLTFRGKNLNLQPLRYNPIHNEYVVNAYIAMESVVQAIDSVLHKNIRFLHGYPSSIYRFARFCRQSRPDIVERLKSSLKGILLGSEYPAPVYRKEIEKVFTAPTLSWYGHSEMAVLAFEKERAFSYRPLQTYGYSEAVQDGEDSFRLVGTSYFNTVSPFIRYDTGDRISPLFKGEILEEFQISSGRVGDFILDKNNQEISLTALIFGRHHPVFSIAHHLQISQDRKGAATIYVTLRNGVKQETINWSKEFDSSAVNMDFGFCTVRKPYMTKAGKIPLLIIKNTQ